MGLVRFSTVIVTPGGGLTFVVSGRPRVVVTVMKLDKHVSILSACVSRMEKIKN